jgi:putative pyruvate formate lyase activating enzyme
VGEETRPERLAAMMLELQAVRCHNINFVTPEHVVPQIVEALPFAIEGGLRVPLVYNTSAYDALSSLELMDGLVDVYMPDFKLWEPESAFRLLKARDYPEVARQAIRAMFRQVGDLRINAQGLAERGLLIRHLVMPNHLAETQAILEWIARTLSRSTYVNLMEQYFPAHKAREHADIARRLAPAEFAEAQRLARRAELTRLDERRPARRLAAF